MPNALDVSVIIVSYNTKNLLQTCLSSIFAQTRGINFEVIVSDNGSKDGSLDMIKTDFSQVILIENNKNLGFGAANNRGLSIARGKYILYLNSDTILLNNAIKLFFDYWEKSSNKEHIGALGCLLYDENMQITHSYGCFPTYKDLCKQQENTVFFHILKTIIVCLKMRKIYERKQASLKYDSQLAGEISGYITGADLFLLNNQDAFFDENYFMYLEETDLQLALKKKGKKRIIIDTPKIQHLSKKIGGKNFIVKFSDVCLQKSALYYCHKNFNMKGKVLNCIIKIDNLHPLVRKMKQLIPD